jgi:predicted metalloprotease
METEDLPESSNIEDRRGEGGSIRGGGGFGGGIPGGASGLSIGTVVVLGLIGYALGIDPRLLIGGAEVLTHEGPTVNSPTTPRQTGTPQDEKGRFVSRVLGSTEVVWKDLFAKDGKTYRAPTLILFRGQTEARCGGVAQSAMGPFYCPNDQKIYLDTQFFDLIETRFRGCDTSRSCLFSQAYVIAHEVGHHVQNLFGVLSRAHSAQQSAGRGAAEANHIQVQVELQADCFAGVWAKYEDDLLRRQGKRAMIEPGDVEAALRTAAAIGDDTLQKRAGRAVVPDSFTHGSSEQRQRWFNNGYNGGEVGSCNTFAATRL